MMLLFGGNHPAIKLGYRMTEINIDEIMEIKLTGVIATQPCVITESGTGRNGVQFNGNMVIDYSEMTVADVIRRCTSNIVIASAPAIRKSIMKYRRKSEIKITAPRPGKRERGTAITTADDVESFLSGKSDDEIAAIMANVTARKSA